jgi:hypothetical protein
MCSDEREKQTIKNGSRNFLCTLMLSQSVVEISKPNAHTHTCGKNWSMEIKNRSEGKMEWRTH